MNFRPSTIITNPYDDSDSFGEIPEISYPEYHFPNGQIYLRYGKHQGMHRGFGLDHIWEQHSADLIKKGFLEKFDAARYVANIIQSGAKIHCEFARMKRERVTVLQSRLGIVVLEHRLDGDNADYYSVVTAHPGRAHGTLIGAIK